MPSFTSPEPAQICLHVKEMSCAHSAKSVMEVLKTLDERATVRIDLPMRRVEIQSVAHDSAVREAIVALGYSTLRQWPAERAYAWTSVRNRYRNDF